MPTPTALLKSIGLALAARLGGGAVETRSLTGDIAEIAALVWSRWLESGTDQTRRNELERLAKATDAEIRSVVAELISAIAPGYTESLARTLATYLCLVPSAIRQAFRRFSDPTGTSLPARFPLRCSEDLLGFLPVRIPCFHVGESPLPGVDWQLTELLGVGGTGEVWKATNPNFKCVPPVALKFCVNSENSEQFFAHEAALLSRAMPQRSHSGLVALRNTYLRSQPPCLEFEYVEGGDLARMIMEWSQEDPRASIRRAARITHRLACIVGHFHCNQPPIVHRDLKPANILIQRLANRRFALKIADFGIGGVASERGVDLTRRNTTRGQLLSSVIRGAHTPLYASPEQVRGCPPDPRDDVHALGVIWHQMITGDMTSGAPTGLDWLAELMDHEMNETQVKLIASCFASKADRRPANAAVLAERILEHFPEARPKSSRRNRRRKVRERSPLSSISSARGLAARTAAAPALIPTPTTSHGMGSQGRAAPYRKSDRDRNGNGSSAEHPSASLGLLVQRKPSPAPLSNSGSSVAASSSFSSNANANSNSNSHSNANAHSGSNPNIASLSSPQVQPAAAPLDSNVYSHANAPAPTLAPVPVAPARLASAPAKIKLLTTGQWKPEDDGVKHVGDLPLINHSIQACLNKLRGLGNKMAALANQIETSLLTKYLAKQLIWNLSKWCYEPSEGRESAQRIARELFGLAPPQFLNERNQPLPDAIGANREYLRWRAIVCGASSASIRHPPRQRDG